MQFIYILTIEKQIARIQRQKQRANEPPVKVESQYEIYQKKLKDEEIQGIKEEE
jgi:hypothetical protein